MRVIIIGAGHAGVEAAYAIAKMGVEAVLVTIQLESIGQMSCNPSIGGIAKGHLVKEIDMLGGLMGKVADASGIHFKILNKSKGPAVRATRTQNDRNLYRTWMKDTLEQVPNIKIYQSIITEIIIKNNKAVGVRLIEGEKIDADAVIIASGTFLNGKIYIGSTIYSAGRTNEPASNHLADFIKGLGFETTRLKTGTPMRLHSDTIDWSKFDPQPGDEPARPFSIFTKKKVNNKVTCYLGHTTPEVKQIIDDNIDLSPLYSGVIEGIGPRYCPSIEDKIIKFPDRDRHHIYLEPEGLTTREIYINGLSSSLPVFIQKKILKAIPGLDKAVMMRPAYAIEYDSILPTQLKHTLESRNIEDLYFAGQVNGTSGYEEAGIQGLLAGVNSVLKLKGETPFIPDRNEAYAGVLIDDIVTKGVDEPYRLFTSRAEFRLRLREDNVFERLGRYSYDLGLISEKDFKKQQARQNKREKVIIALDKFKAKYKKKGYTLSHLLKMPEHDYYKVEELYGEKLAGKLDEQDVAYIEASVKYAGYIRIQNEEIKKLKGLKDRQIPEDIDYYKIDGLSTEVRQKLTKKQPVNLLEAIKIPGVTPASVNAISIYLTIQSKKRTI